MDVILQLGWHFCYVEGEVWWIIMKTLLGDVCCVENIAEFV